MSTIYKLDYFVDITKTTCIMKNITIQTKEGKQIVSGALGQDIITAEGYYYFPKESVNFDLLTMKPAMYTCPIKQSTCDYYYVKDQNDDSVGSEIAWVYEKINNSLFSQIEGMVGFYPKSTAAADFIESEI